MFQHFRRLAATLGALVPLAGCLMQNSVTPQQATAGTEIVRDKSQGLVYVRGPILGEGGLYGAQTRQIVTALTNAGEISSSWIEYVENTQGKLTYYSSAQDEFAHPFKVEKLDRARGTRDAYPIEVVAVDLPDGYVREHLHDPINIRLDGRRGYIVLSFGSSYVAGYWSKLLMAQACVRDNSC